MPEAAEKSVLRRMAGLRAEPMGLAEMTAAKALRIGFAKAGDDVLDTAVGVRELSEQTVVPDDIAEGLPDPALYMRMAGPGGAVAIAIACPQLVGAVIEATTMGMVLTAAAADRRPTRTDAMLVAEFLDPALHKFAALAAGCAKPPLVDGYNCGPALPDLRAAQMLMADSPHRHYRLELDFNNGAKVGRLLLYYPTDRAATATARPEQTQWHATLENAVMGTTARMEAVLCRLKRPLGEITGLKAGDVLALDGASLDGLMLLGSDGGPVMSARLGRSGPMRAVRLMLDGKRKAAQPGDMAQVSAPLAGMDRGGAAAPLPLDNPAAGLDAPEPLPLDGGVEMPAGGMEPAPMAMNPGVMEPAPMEMEPAPLAMEPNAMETELPDLPALAEPLPLT